MICFCFSWPIFKISDCSFGQLESAAAVVLASIASHQREQTLGRWSSVAKVPFCLLLLLLLTQDPVPCDFSP
jgi:hypothetical protein